MEFLANRQCHRLLSSETSHGHRHAITHSTQWTPNSHEIETPYSPLCNRQVTRSTNIHGRAAVPSAPLNDPPNPSKTDVNGPITIRLNFKCDASPIHTGPR